MLYVVSLSILTLTAVWNKGSARHSCRRFDVLRGLNPVRSDDAIERGNRQQISEAGDFDDRGKAKIGRDDRRGRGPDDREAAVDAPRPDEHVILAETTKRRHRDRHRE